MAPGADAVALCALALMAALPRVFFRRGRLGVHWWLTASPFFVAGIAVAAGALGTLEPLLPRSSPAGVLLGWCGVAAGALSIAWMGGAMGSHARPVSLWHQEGDEPEELVTWGAYARVRHPFYAAFLLALLASVLAVPHPVTLLAFVTGALQLHRTATREERRLLGSALGPAYRAYRGRTRRFWPRLGRGLSRKAAGTILTGSTARIRKPEEAMPNIKSAQKRMELSRKARERNRAKRSHLRTALKRVREAEGVEQGRLRLQQAVALLDRAASKRLIHPNKAARLKGQLARYVDKLSA